MSNFAPSARTTDATPKQMPGAIAIEPDAVCRCTVYVFANDHAGNVSIWQVEVNARRIGSGNVAALTTVTRQNTPGNAAAWAIGIDLSNLVDIRCMVTGSAGQVIDWLFMNDEPVCMAGSFPG